MRTGGMGNGLSRRTVLVTGGGRGIGAACAELFYLNHFNVVVFSQTASEVHSVEERATKGDRERWLTLVGDVSDDVFVTQAFAEAQQKFGGIDILVNNAAFLVKKPFCDLSTQDFERSLSVNVTGVFLCSRAFFRQFKERGSSDRVIINLNSLGGLQGTEKFPGLSAYVASKFAVTGLTEAMAVEGQPLGIRVVGLAPGAVDTRMLKEAAPHLKAGAVPMDIAKEVLALANSMPIGIVSGQTIPLDTNR